MARYPRYAIYYAPPTGSDLMRFGSRLLGYDAYQGNVVPFPDDVTRAAPDWNDLTEDPRKYGFHATLKAPFALAPGKSPAELEAACRHFADTARPIPVITPVVAALSGFIAVVPSAPPAELGKLAQDCIEAFDEFRAPLNTEDRARRRPDQLSARQVAHLDRWGYPYVMEEFRFHMTLTGRIPEQRRDPLLAILRARFAALNLATLPIDRIALCRQDDATARFRITGVYSLRSIAS